MQLSISLVSVLVGLEKPFRLRFLTCLHPLRNHIGEAALTQHLQDMLAVELPVHQHIVDVKEGLCRVQEVFDYLFTRVAFPNWARIENYRNSVSTSWTVAHW